MLVCGSRKMMLVMMIVIMSVMMMVRWPAFAGRRPLLAKNANGFGDDDTIWR